jgi:hypothetical protein
VLFAKKKKSCLSTALLSFFVLKSFILSFFFQKRKGTEGIIKIENPNLVKPKNVKAKEADVSLSFLYSTFKKNLSLYGFKDFPNQTHYCMYLQIRDVILVIEELFVCQCWHYC